MRFKKIIVTTLSATFVLSASLTQAASAPRGWSGDYITMAAIAEGEQNIANYNQLIERLPIIPVKNVAIFTYANGGDDTYTISSDHKNKLDQEQTKVAKFIVMTRDLEKSTGKNVMPVLVVYTSGASASTTAMDIDFGFSQDPVLKNNLKFRFYDLITLAQQIEKTKDENHPIPATIVMNPDFLGEANKIYTDADWAPQTTIDAVHAIDPSKQIQGHIPLKTALANAYKDMGVKEPTDLPDFITDNGNLRDYVQTLNWIIKTNAPDVVFGLEDAMWAGDSAGHKWIHQPDQPGQPTMVDQHVKTEVNFLKLLQVYNFGNPYRPDFFSFDKYERDDFDGAANSYNNGYLYNIPAWNRYMSFVSNVSIQMGNLPILLFQYQGGHLQTVKDSDPRVSHGATGATYFFGDATLNPDLSNIKNYINILNFLNPKSDYSTQDTSVMDYLNTLQNDPGWGKDHIQNFKSANVFAVLWGGGNTTSIATFATDDNGWLVNKIAEYYNKKAY